MIAHPTSDAYDARREHRHRGKKKYAEIDARSVYHFSILGCWTGLLDADVCSTFAEEANDDGIESETSLNQSSLFQLYVLSGVFGDIIAEIMDFSAVQ